MWYKYLIRWSRRAIRDLFHLGNRNRRPRAARSGRLHIGFRGEINPVLPSFSSYNLYVCNHQYLPLDDVCQQPHPRPRVYFSLKEPQEEENNLWTQSFIYLWWMGRISISSTEQFTCINNNSSATQALSSSNYHSYHHVSLPVCFRRLLSLPGAITTAAALAYKCLYPAKRRQTNSFIKTSD